ncbi:MAG: hypothetical protein HY698_20120 [Deltaproteobacteria bacterium]|nr:hypothetical protein [Deltaproteobacteria bacterium]
MTDDQLLKALGQLAREQRAMEEPSVTSLSDTAKDKLAARLLAEVRRGSQNPGPTGHVIPSRTKAIRASMLGVPLAMAAALALWLTTTERASLAPLPNYEMVASGGARDFRSGEPSRGEEPIVLVPGTRLDLHLRPATPVVGRISTRVHAVQNGQAREIGVQEQVSDEGAVRISVPAEAIPNPGEWEVVVVLGRAGAVPETLAAAERDRSVLVFRRRARRDGEK